MNHFFLIVVSVNLPFISRVEREHVYTFVVYGNEFFFAYEIEACNLRFPQLKTLMSKHDFLLITRNIDYLNIISVHINGLKTNDQFLKLLFMISDYVNVAICNVEFVFPF
jgi:hypothetical protein